LESLNLVSAIIPARNEEASIARAVESVAAQPEVGEVIVVDDQSTDRTGEILAELAVRTPKLRVLATDALPAGWTGKNYAVSIGAAAATGDWLLFTDADTYHLPGSTRRALADAVKHDAAMVSYSPEQEMETFWEKALIPVVFERLSRRFQFQRINDSRLPDAAANGQFLLISHEAYTSLGGHGSVAADVIEDVALARRAKTAGYRIYFAPGFEVVRTRMYRSFPAMWEGWTKNLYPLVGGSAASIAHSLLPLWHLIAFACLWEYSHYFYGVSVLFLPIFLVTAVLELQIAYAVDVCRNCFPPQYIKYYVPGVFLYPMVLIASWWKNTRGRVSWKGRFYTPGAPRVV